MNEYNLIAPLYDHFGLDKFSCRMMPYIKRLLGRDSLRGLKVLDLACGTGSLALAMSSECRQVVGLDCSEEMLRIARRKARGKKNALKFVRQDLRTFQLECKFDLITCVFDSLNHITNLEDLRTCLANVRDHLHPRGCFVFDLNTPYGLRRNWSENTFTRKTARLFSVWSCICDSRRRVANVQITVFKKTANALYKISMADIWERAYTGQELQKSLNGAGLKILKAYQCFKYKKPDRRTDRVIYVCGLK